MDILRNILIVILGCVGLYLIGLNWLILWKIVIMKEHHSVVPFLGGGLLAVVVLLTPMWSLWWIALIVDWGSAPWFLCSLGVVLLRRIRKPLDQ